MPSCRQIAGEPVHEPSAIHPPPNRKQGCPALAGVFAGKDTALIRDGLGGHPCCFPRGAHRPAAHSDVWPIIDVIVVDTIVLVLLAADLAEVAAVEALFVGIPIVESTVLLGQV